MSSSSSSSAESSVRYYGHEATATTAARYISHLFACPNLPPPSVHTQVRPPLAGFVAYALYRTQLPPSVTTASLLLLARLKARYPQAKGSSGHRLFIAAFMMASKNLCDDTYSNKSWCVVAQSMFPLSEINQMEREMLGYLEWNIDTSLEQLQDLDDDLALRFSSSSLPSSYASSSTHPYGSASTAQPVAAQPQYSAPTYPTEAYPSPPSSPPSSHMSSLDSTPCSSNSSSPSSCETPPQNLAGGTSSAPTHSSSATSASVKIPASAWDAPGTVRVAGVDDE